MLDFRELMDTEVIVAYGKYTVLVLVKMMLMSIVTAYYRIKKKAYANPEDVPSSVKDDKKYVRSDPDVERVRRIHRNDLENIVPFMIIGLFYAVSGVSLSTALLHYRIFFASRVFHTLAYLIPLPQPCRGLAWTAGYLVTFSMVFQLALLALKM